MVLNFNDTHIFDIPKSFWDISNFRSTLGHKVNHSFKFSKSGFGHAFHPRFGNIRSIVAISNITKGEEILIDYGYTQGVIVPNWYSALYLKEMGKHWVYKAPSQNQPK